MSLLYSNVPPLRLKNEQSQLSDYVIDSMSKADSMKILVGYVSKNGLIEIDNLVREYKLSNVILVMGMYCIEGFPEGIYNTAIRINEEWQEEGIGEIRITPSMKYHGKVYCFYENGKIFTGAIGSHNLGTMVVDANNRRQYEISIVIDNEIDLTNINEHVSEVIKEPVSVVISDYSNINIVRAENDKLTDVEGVMKVNSEDVEFYKKAMTDISFDIPLKVPGIPDCNKDYMRSNINKCYAKGRLNSKTGVVTERGWWETEIIVANTITGNPNYPEYKVPFYVITDDGWKFKAHASGDYKKNFESHDDLKILGYWLKGRLVAAGFVEPVDSPAKDLENILESGVDIYKNCKGVITYQKLIKYGRTSLKFTKTVNKLADENGKMLDVWVLSFLPQYIQ